MNQDNDKQAATEVDPQVSGHYKSLADEKTPADLDRAVLREARRALRADNRKGSFGAWFRPVAVMATVGLSLAIILDLSDTSILNPAADMSLDTAPPTPVQAPAATPADVAGKNLSQTAISEFKRQEKSLPEQSLAVDAPAKTQPQGEPFEDHAEVSEVFTAEAQSAGQRIQKLNAAANARLQPQAAPAAQFAAPQSATAFESLSQVAQPVCSDEQKSDVELWWKCIDQLRQSGMIEAADLELEYLREDFPDFEPPE